MTAREKILSKALVTSGLSSAEIDRLLAGLKDRAFFSARCESVRHLQTAQAQVADWLGSAKRADGAFTTRASAVSAIMESARRQGLSTGTGTVADPASAARAKVIVDTNADLARGHVARVQGASTGARLAFPAQELIRAEERQARRDWRGRWTAAGGQLHAGRMIALKEDPVWIAISRFGVPYPPFDYGSGMGVADVDRDTCLRLGVIKDDYRPEGDLIEDFNATLEAQMEFKGAADPGWRFLKDSFGDQVKYDDGKIRWQADIIKDALSNPADIHVGVSPMPEFKGRKLTVPKSDFEHLLIRHVGYKGKPPESSRLTERELQMLPSVWRHPDRVIPQGGTTHWVEYDSADGSVYRIVTDVYPSEVSFRTFYKPDIKQEKKGA